MKQLIYFILFTIPLVGSPGPVNILLAGLGANHGIVKNIPLVAGLICSATVISFVCLAGFQIVLQNMAVHNWIVIVGSFYIMYLAIKLYRLKPAAANDNVAVHRFYDGLFVTLLNPKFYIMVSAVFAQFIGADKSYALFIAAGFIFLLFAAHVAWLGLGKILKHTLQTNNRLRMLNKSMGSLLFIFAVYFLLNQITQ